MGLFDFFRKLLGMKPALPPADQGHDVEELARRLAMRVSELEQIEPSYHTFTINKRTGGQRTITAPNVAFKTFQRRVLKRLLSRLPIHPAAMGFRKGLSIADHALMHAMRPVVVKMDIRDFFPSTSTERIHRYFRMIGWNDEATKLITKWCTHEGGLPQGAPTSPCLSNAVNYLLDARLHGMAQTLGDSPHNPKTLEMVEGGFDAGGFYSRYADDITISFKLDIQRAANQAIHLTKEIVSAEGYRLHTKKKLRIMREHDRQIVTGLVVNEGVRLPRETRRKLRAVRHHLETGRRATLTPQQLAGWEAYESMIANVGQA